MGTENIEHVRLLPTSEGGGTLDIEVDVKCQADSTSNVVVTLNIQNSTLPRFCHILIGYFSMDFIIPKRHIYLW